MVCDDEKDIAEVIDLVLSEKGYQVKAVLTTKGIFEVVSQWLPDIILIDLRMPEMSGKEVIKQLKKNSKTKHIPIVIITANYETKKIAKKIGADNFISKPFNLTDLEEIVGEYA